MNCSRCDEPTPPTRRRVFGEQVVVLCVPCHRFLWRHPAHAHALFPRWFPEPGGEEDIHRERLKSRSKQTNGDVNPWGGEWSPWAEAGDLAAMLVASPRSVAEAGRMGHSCNGHEVERTPVDEVDLEPRHPNTQNFYRARKQ